MALRREEGEQRHHRHRGGGWPRRALHARLRLGAPLPSPPKDPTVEEPPGPSTPTFVGTPEELDRLKDQFLRVAAHELKTPVAVVMGYAETLSRMAKDLPPGQRRMLDGLLRGAGRIDRIVADLLFLSQIQLDRLNLVVERLDLGALVDRVVTRQRLRAPERRIQITHADPVVLQGDRELLERVMAHLIDNALRYSPDGGDVEVTVQIEGSEDAVVSVRDHGVGIPSRERAKIFECFHRAHTDTPHDYGGMGTGLYLSRSVVRRHGGEMSFESEEGRGSTFQVRLPLGVRGTTAPS